MQPALENPRWRPLYMKYVYLSLYTRWQRNSNGYTCVSDVQLSNGSDEDVVLPNGEKPEVENPRWRPLNLNYVYLSLYTRWQRNFKGYTHIFGIKQHGRKNVNTLLRRGKW